VARAVSLRAIREQARARADMASSEFVTDSELNGYVSSSYAELYNALIQSGGDYFLASTDIAVTAATDTYDLPEGFYKLRGVDVDFGDGAIEAEPFVFAERNAYPGATAALGSYTATIWYYPAPPVFVGDDQSVDGVAGWEEYVVLGAAIKCLLKEESDVRELAALQQAKLAEILSTAGTRDAGRPDRVTDVYATNNLDYDGASAKVRYRLWGGSQIRLIAYRVSA
jgi:hypothetical protein